MPTNSQKVTDAIQQMAALDPSNAAKWLEANQKNFTDDELVTILKKGAEAGAPQTGINKKNAPTVIKRTSSNHSTKVDESVTVPDLGSAAKAAVTAATQTGGHVNADLDGDGKIEPAEQAALDKESATQAKAASKASGVPEAQTKTAIDTTLGLIDPSLAPPPAEIAKYLGANRPLTTEESANLIKSYNEAHPDMPVSDVSKVYERLGLVEISPTGTRREGSLTDPDAIAIVEEGLLGKEPQTSFSIALPGGGSYTVSSTNLKQFKAFQDNMSNGDLTRIVRAASRFGIKDPNGDQPAWQMLAAIVKAKGIDITNTAFSEDAPGLLTKAPQQATNMGPNNEQHQIPTSVSGRTGPLTDPDAKKALQSGRSLAALSLKFNEGESMYGGNQVLAYVHTLNPSLASRWANTKPSERTYDDQVKMQQYLVNGGLSDKSFMGLALDSGDSGALTNDWDQEHFGKDGGAGSVRTLPDPVAVRQSARDMYIKMFAAEPTAQQLNQFAAVVNGAISGAGDNQNIDATAQIQNALENTPLYHDLYGKKMPGTTDQDYRAQFDNGAASLLGAEAPDPFTIQLGMQSGQYQTTLGAIAGTKQAYGNSTFLQRLAQASQIVSQNT